MICNGVGVGLMLDPEDGEVCIVLSLFHTEEDADNEPRDLIRLMPDRAAAIGLDLLARASTGQQIVAEIMNTPMDDRPATIAKIVARLHGGFN